MILRKVTQYVRTIPLAVTTVSALLLANIALASDAPISITSTVDTYYNQHIKEALHQPAILEAIEKSDVKFRNMGRHELVLLNEAWIHELKTNTPVSLEALLRNPISQKLKEIQNTAEGLIVSASIVNSIGVSAGQTHVTPLRWYSDDTLLHALLKRRSMPSSIYTDIQYDEDTHFFRITGYYPIEINQNSRALFIMNIDLNKADYLAHVEESHWHGTPHQKLHEQHIPHTHHD